MDEPSPSGAAPIADTPAQPVAAPAPKPTSELRETVLFLVKLAIIVFVVRSFLFSPFSIPSGSMLPRLLIGDFLFITKWDYGYSRHSLPWSLPLIPGRIFADDPTRGDVAVFKAPPTAEQDWIKRVIGLPGDTIQMRRGQLVLNGKPVPKERIADFVLPISPNFSCRAEFQGVDPEGRTICRYPRFRETLPNGKSYAVLDQGYFGRADDTDVYTVPAGHVFMMGDNRDDSTDSRFAHIESGISFVPMTNLEGRAIVNFWSTDGSAEWIKPWTWLTAARWRRIGEGF